jgi:hypothetical protein
MSHHEHDHEPPVPGRHDDRDVNLRVIVRIAIVIALGTAAAFVLAAVIWRGLTSGERAGHRPAPPMATAWPSAPPEPRLEPMPRATLERLRAAEDARLASYGWVDKERGVVHIPVARAMDLLLARGLPARQPGAAPAPDRTTVPTEASLAGVRRPEESR